MLRMEESKKLLKKIHLYFILQYNGLYINNKNKIKIK